VGTSLIKYAIKKWKQYISKVSNNKNSMTLCKALLSGPVLHHP